MSNRIYPRKAWVLQPSFKPKEVELIKPYRSFGGADYGDLTAESKLYAASEMFDTMRAAVDEGWRRIEKQQADLDKKAANLAKRKKALQAATAALEAA